jgi:hypothetical protein
VGQRVLVKFLKLGETSPASAPAAATATTTAAN